MFSRIGRLDLIERLAPAILIPYSVIEEVRPVSTRPDGDNGIGMGREVPRRGYRGAASIEHWDIGLGESQVIAHSVGRSRWAVLDDRAARVCAVAHNVRVIGTLGIVLRAKKNRRIDRARPLVKELVDAGMFLDDEFVDRALARVAE